MGTDVTSNPPNPRRNARKATLPDTPAKSIARRDYSVAVVLTILLLFTVLYAMDAGWRVVQRWWDIQEVEAATLELKQHNDARRQAEAEQRAREDADVDKAIRHR